ncbi:MAG: exo-alpha-sialidase [Planctomycetes bacterium]|nr:exo-alpha-sialidase [Planctomycetota bacterium]
MNTKSAHVRVCVTLLTFAFTTFVAYSTRSDDSRPKDAPAGVQPPFRVAPGLFDANDLKTLGLRTVNGTHSLLYQASDDDYKFCHHPNLVVFKNQLYCMWSNGLVHEDAPGQRILYSRSGDGVTWTKPELLTDDRQGKGICVAAGFHVIPNKLVAYYTATGGENFHPDTALMARTSLDGKKWSQPLRVTSGFFIEGPQRLAGGRLLFAGEYVGDSRATMRMRFLFTNDRGGISQLQNVTVNPPELKVYGYTEPSFYLRPDGSVVATLRNYSGFLHTSASTDNGETWSPVTQTNLPDSTARTSAGNLPDGTAYIINNSMPKQFDRSLLTIALSRDGKTFDRAWIVRGEPTKMRYEGRSKLDGWQYPHAVVWKDTLYVAYSINKEDVALTRITLKDLAR